MRRIIGFSILMGAALLTAARSEAAALPGPADAGRIEQREMPVEPQPEVSLPGPEHDIFPALKAPEGSQNIKITIKNVRIEGMTVFSRDDVKDIYAGYIGREVPLSTAWQIAAKLTDQYRNEGYLLSRVFVPKQQIDDGVVVLRVLEGYIGEVEFKDPLASDRIVAEWLEKLKSYRPVSADQIESVLLHLNDLPGVNVRAVLQPMRGEQSAQGAVRLVLEKKPTPLITGTVEFDNYGSRYLGPYEAEAQASLVFMPGQKTTASVFGSIPWDKVKYGSLKHEAALFPDLTLEVYGSYTGAKPGYTLKPEDIESTSATVGVAFDYSVIRQREQNLTARVALEGQNTHSDILDTPLSRDHVRAVRGGLSYQLADGWDGQNEIDGTVSHGLNILDASQKGQAYVSRAGASPDFTKFDFDASRLQPITDDWSVLLTGAAQVASGPLYSSEQFGYGGQAFGRAYDYSELTGDNGVEGAAELRYGSLGPWLHLKPVPYGFYDIGDVWNLGANQETPYASASSAGAGFRILSDIGFSGNFGVAFPLTHKVETPIYGSGWSPRYYLQISYSF